MSIKRFLKKLQRVEVKAVPTPVYSGDLLKGKTALIIGGCGGIGYEISRKFLDSGCRIIITGTDRERLAKASASLSDCGYYLLDVCSIESMRSVLEDVFAQNDHRVDIAVYAAGVHGPADFLEITESDFDSVMDVNLKGMFFADQIIGKLMMEHSIRGHILNISSSSALKNGFSPYEISKNAVSALVKGCAQRFIPYNIVVNGLGPGPVATKMLGRTVDNMYCAENPTKRMASPQEIANWALFLCSSLGDLVVGETVYVSGGSGTLYTDR